MILKMLNKRYQTSVIQQSITKDNLSLLQSLAFQICVEWTLLPNRSIMDLWKRNQTCQTLWDFLPVPVSWLWDKCVEVQLQTNTERAVCCTVGNWTCLSFFLKYCSFLFGRPQKGGWREKNTCKIVHPAFDFIDWSVLSFQLKSRHP